MNKISSAIKNKDLIKPSFTAFLKTVLRKDDNAVKAMPLSNNAVCKRIDEMSEDTETQLQEKCREQHQDLCMAFVDLTRAFDTVNRDLLRNIL